MMTLVYQYNNFKTIYIQLNENQETEIGIRWTRASLAGAELLFHEPRWNGIPLAFTVTSRYCISKDLSANPKELNI